MRKVFQLVLATVGVFVYATAVSADPIVTKPGQCFTAMWVKAKETDCSKVCRKLGLSAESMTLSSVGNQRIFVCRKHRGNYAFGEQGSGNCRVLDRGTPTKLKKYECLCARTGCGAGNSPARPARRQR
jgi:hypothetical protein